MNPLAPGCVAEQVLLLRLRLVDHASDARSAR